MGIRMIVRGVVADIADTFNRPDGLLAGSSTTTGAKPWQVIGANAVPSIVSGTLRATSGAGNALAVVDTGVSDIDMVYTLAAVRTTSAVPAAVFRAVDADNYWCVNHRVSLNDPQYTLAKRVNGAVTTSLMTNVIPAPGDTVTVKLRGISAELIVNSVSLGKVTIDGTSKLAGFSVFGGDTSTAFDNFAVYRRSLT